jgi:hypothetical protein
MRLAWGTVSRRSQDDGVGIDPSPFSFFADIFRLSANQPSKICAGLVITSSAEAGTASRPAPRSMPALDEQGARGHCPGHDRGVMLPQASLPVGDRSPRVRLGAESAPSEVQAAPMPFSLVPVKPLLHSQVRSATSFIYTP